MNHFMEEPFRALELTLLWTSECLGMSTFFCGIMETVPSLFRVIFLIEIPFPTLARWQVSVASPLSVSPLSAWHILGGWHVSKLVLGLDVYEFPRSFSAFFWISKPGTKWSHWFIPEERCWSIGVVNQTLSCGPSLVGCQTKYGLPRGYSKMRANLWIWFIWEKLADWDHISASTQAIRPLISPNLELLYIFIPYGILHNWSNFVK